MGHDEGFLFLGGLDEKKKKRLAAVTSAAETHHAHPRPPSAQQSRQGGTVGHDEQRHNDVLDGALCSRFILSLL